MLWPRAESLSGTRRNLSLNGLTSLSDKAAEDLSKFRGRTLYLLNLTSLSETAVNSLREIERPVMAPKIGDQIYPSRE